MKILIKFRKTIMLIMKLMIMLALIFCFIGSIWQKGTDYEKILFENKGNYLVVFSYAVILSVFIYLYGAFKIGMSRLHEIAYSFLLSIAFCNFIMYLVLSLMARKMLDPMQIIWMTVFQMVLMGIGVVCANSVYFKLYRAKQILAIYGKDKVDQEIIKKMKRIKERYTIDKGMSINEDMRHIKAEIDKYEAVLIGDLEKSKKNEILRYTYSTGKRIYLLPSVNDIIVNSCYQSQVFDTPVLICKNRGLSIEQQIVKRFIDILISGIALLIVWPFMLITAILIKMDDRGPVFFKQNRVTKDGKIFNVYKFRSMIVDADKDGAQKATDNDNRITRIGKIIRVVRLDELPQLLNIIKGDMSVVGPRPERTENVHEYTTTFPEFDLRHRVKGGLTGYAQIYGKYNTSPTDKLNMDLIYIEKYSIFLDIKLMIMTIKILFMRGSTEGFDEAESMNALEKSYTSNGNDSADKTDDK